PQHEKRKRGRDRHEAGGRSKLRLHSCLNLGGQVSEDRSEEDREPPPLDRSAAPRLFQRPAPFAYLVIVRDGADRVTWGPRLEPVTHAARPSCRGRDALEELLRPPGGGAGLFWRGQRLCFSRKPVFRRAAEEEARSAGSGLDMVIAEGLRGSRHRRSPRRESILATLDIESPQSL